MSVASISNNDLSLYLNNIQSVSSTQFGNQKQSVSSFSGTTQVDKVDMSKPAELMSKLQQLKDSDPSKFNEVCTKISEKLKTEAENLTGRDKEMVSDLATKFESVANGGDISELKPPPPPPRQGGAQGNISQFTNQDDSLMKMISNNNASSNGPSDTMKSIMDSIISEVENA